MFRSVGGYMLSWRSHITVILSMTLLYTVSGVTDDNKPAIVGGINAQDRSKGDTVHLYCKVKNQGNFKVTWRQSFNYNDIDITSGSTIVAWNPSGNPKYQLDVGTNIDDTVSYNLTIYNFQEIDAGLYTCSLDSTLPPISESGRILLRGIAFNAPLVVYDIVQVEGKVGENVTLRCVVAYKGTNQVKWRRVKDNQEISSDSTILVNTVLNGTKKYTLTTETLNSGEQFDLTVNKLTTDDNGEYECQIRTSSQPYPARKGTVFVQVPPVISSPNPENVTLQIGGNVDLTCTATGAPTPNTVVWQRVNFFDLPNGDQTYKGSTISIVNANKDQRGLYRCQATNNVLPGAEKIFRVFVKFAPKAQAKANMSQAIGFPVTIDCIIGGYPDISPAWYKLQSEGRTQVTESPGYIVTHTAGDGINGRIATNTFSLRIEKVAVSDYGEYQCEGVSSLGSSAATIKITQSSTCEGIGCRISRPEQSTKARESTKCKDDCTGGSQSLQRVGVTCILFMTIIISLKL